MTPKQRLSDFYLRLLTEGLPLRSQLFPVTRRRENWRERRGSNRFATTFAGTEVANWAFQSLSQFIPIRCQPCPNCPEPAERHLVLSSVWSGAGAQPPALKTVRLERVSGVRIP